MFKEYILNLFGLFLNISGAVIITLTTIFESRLYNKRHSKGAPLGVSPEHKKQYRWSGRITVLGLIILIIGFVLQFIASY